MQSYRRILVAVDLTENSERIAARGQMLAEASDAELELVHVVETLLVTAPIPPEAVTPAIIDTQRELILAAEQHLRRLAESGPRPARWSVPVGSIKAEIVRLARDHHTDLIVLGSREKHGLAIIFGPTEDAVLHSAPCDVLAVRIAV